MYLAVALLGIGSVAIAMLQWNSDEAPVDLIPAPTPAVGAGTEQVGCLPADR